MPLDVKQANPSQKMGFKGRGEFIGLIASLMAVNALAIDIMLPGLQEIGASLGVTSENHRQFIITAYLLGFGISQLLYGPLSDRFGRRKPLFIGIAIYVITSLAAGFVTSFSAMIFLRILQGVGAAATRVIAVSIVRDLYSGRAMAEIMSLTMMVFMILPVIAPATGQVIMLFGDWHLIFISMAVMASIVLIWAYIRLPETLKDENRRPFTGKGIANSFKIVISNRVAVCYTLGISFILGALFGFIGSAQQIYVGIYHLDELFPLAFAAVAVTMAIASFVNSQLVGRFGMRRISQLMLISFIGFSVLWCILSISFTDPIPLWLLMPIYMIIMFSFGLVTSNFNALAMEPLGAIAGTASSVLGFTQTVVGASLGALIGQAFDGTTTPISLGFVAVGCIAFIFLLIAEKGKLFQSHNQPMTSKTSKD